MVAAVAAALLAVRVPVLVVSPEPLRPGAAETVVPFVPGQPAALSFRHSVWGVTVVERFRMEGAGLRLVAVEAPTPDVDAYYHIGGARLEGRPGTYRLEVPANPPLRALRVRATPLGVRTLVVGRRCLPLLRVGDVVVLRTVPVPPWELWRATRRQRGGPGTAWEPCGAPGQPHESTAQPAGSDG